MASDRTEFLQDVGLRHIYKVYGMAANGLPCFCG
nr:MAG TPA: hypothetical protein [Caudoviricetes sp.]